MHSISGRPVNQNFLKQEYQLEFQEHQEYLTLYARLFDHFVWLALKGLICLFAQRHSKMAVEKCLRENENEKKRSDGNRVLQIENWSFTLLVFTADGGMRKECIRFYKRLTQMIADYRKALISIVTNNITSLIWFSVLRSTIKCLTGSKSPRYSHTKDIDIKVNALITVD